MTTIRRLRLAAAGACGLLLTWAGPGCGGNEPPPDPAKPVELSPGMEQMKGEMMKSFSQSPQGKRVLKADQPAP